MTNRILAGRFIVSFAMLSQFFFLALYMQNILHYSPLASGPAVPAVDCRDRDHGPDRRPADVAFTLVQRTAARAEPPTAEADRIDADATAEAELTLA